MIFKILKDLITLLQTGLPETKFQLNYLPGKDTSNQAKDDYVYLTLLNISEDLLARNVYNLPGHRNRPPLYLNLTVMVTSFYKNYEDGLKAIAGIITLMESNPKREVENINYLISMENISLDQNSNLWQSLSSVVLPNAIYKLRASSVISESPRNPPVIEV